MKKYLLIANAGLMEVEALTLVGASTKAGDNTKIGMFGSGNKYALAYLLRNNYDVLIYSGMDRITLDTVHKEFREQEFDVITVDGKETSITTQMGRSWELWQAIRELYANALDEGSMVLEEVDNIEPNEDSTHIYIGMTGELESFMFNIRDYFARDKEVVYENEHGKVYRKHSSKACIYRKGIRCNRDNKESLFDYDFNELQIDENRLAMFSWSIPEAIYELFSKCKDPKLIRELLVSISDNGNILEADIDTSLYTLRELDQETVREAMQGKQAVPKSLGGLVGVEDIGKTVFLPGKLYNSVVGAGVKESDAFTITGSGLVYTDWEPEALELHMLKDVMYFFDECGLKEIAKYDIKVVKFDNPDIHGAAVDGEILVGKTAFDKGKHWIASTILEEYIHIKTGAGDKTRKMQNAILDEFLNYMKNKNAFDL